MSGLRGPRPRTTDRQSRELRATRLSAGLTQTTAAQRLVAAGLSRDASGRRLRGWEAGSFARLAPAVQAAVLEALKGAPAATSALTATTDGSLAAITATLATLAEQE